MKAIRARVSGSRVRYMKEGFDLDLTYITPYLIAMGYPASGMEKTYRNDIVEVSAFLNQRHPGAYRVYNLSERKYDYSKFEQRVSECGFPDHHPPPLQLLLDIMNDMLKWTKQRDNVVVVHCLAGKGRTGVVCSCFLLLTGFYGDIYALKSDREMRQMANEAIRDFWNARGQGVRYPSQALYIYYFLRVMRRLREKPSKIPRLRPAKKMILKSVVLNGIPDYEASPRGGCTPFLQVLPAPSQHYQPELLYNSSWQNANFETYAADPKGSIVFETNCIIQGDVLIRCFHANSFSMVGKHVVQMFHVTFNTDFFNKDCDLYRLRKKEVDEAHDNARFPSTFCLDCHVELLEDDDDNDDIGDAEDAMVLNTQRLELLDQELRSSVPTNNSSALRQSAASQEPKQEPRRSSLQRTPSLQPKSTATMMGWLYKQGGFVKSWKKRWFVARDGQLTYYQNASDPTPLGVVDLKGVHVDTAFAEETSAKNRFLNYFKVVPKRKDDRTWFFGAETEQEMAKWIRVLSAQACFGIKPSETQPQGDPRLEQRRSSLTYRSSESATQHGSQRRATFNDQRLSDSRVALGGSKRAASSMINISLSSSSASIASNVAVHGSFGGPRSVPRESPPNSGSGKPRQVARVNTLSSGRDAFFTPSLDESPVDHRHLLLNEEDEEDDEEDDEVDSRFLKSAVIAPSYVKSKPLGNSLHLSERERQTMLEQVTDDFKVGLYIYTADELQTASKMQQYVTSKTMTSNLTGKHMSVAKCVRHAVETRNFSYAEQVIARIVQLKFPTLTDAMDCNPAMFIDTICGRDAIDAGANGLRGSSSAPSSERSRERRSQEIEF